MHADGWVLLAALGLTGCAAEEGASPDPTRPDPTVPATVDTESPVSGEPSPDGWLALVTGTLFTSDLADAQAYHDEVAGSAHPDALALGDVGHEVFVGTPLLGGSTEAFLAVDEWDDLDGMATLYEDPEFGVAIGGLFAGPPTIESFGHEPGWYQWGDLDAADASDPRWFVVVRGTLAAPTFADAQAAHDGVAAYGEPLAASLGDVAHVVYLGVDDWRQFLAIDVWTDDASLEALYTDPAFVESFAAVFSGAPALSVYASTDWYQW